MNSKLTAGLLISFIFFFKTCDLFGKIINAATGSRQDIQNAINAATKGDTVRIPSGQFSFSGTVQIDAGITIMGAGIDQTILQKIDTSGKHMFQVDCSNGEQIIITGITFIGVSDGTRDRGLDLDNHCKNFRIYNCSFKKFNWAGIQIRGKARGVVDHCQFIDNYLRGFGYGLEILGDSDASWQRPLELGTENAVFVEDCYFRGCRHTIAANNGARYVFRHNQIEDNREDAAAIDAHGLVSSWPRGTRSYEIYENTISNSIERWAGIGIRGGDGVIFNNTMIRGIEDPIKLWNDGGNNCYPCKDQIRELYIWNNTYQGQPAAVTFWRGSERVIREGRDFFQKQRPGYTPYLYPHPLVFQDGGGAGTDIQPPNPPQNLRFEQQ